MANENYLTAINENYLTAIDERGFLVRIPIENLPTFTLFGLDIASIAALRHQYLLHGGYPVITQESIEETFGIKLEQ